MSDKRKTISYNLKPSTNKMIKDLALKLSEQLDYFISKGDVVDYMAKNQDFGQMKEYFEKRIF